MADKELLFNAFRDDDYVIALMFGVEPLRSAKRKESILLGIAVSISERLKQQHHQNCKNADSKALMITKNISKENQEWIDSNLEVEKVEKLNGDVHARSFELGMSLGESIALTDKILE